MNQHSLTQKFRASSFCETGACVAVGQTTAGQILIKDTKAKSGPFLEFTLEEWTAFVAGVQNHEFDFGNPMVHLSPDAE